MRIKYEKLVDKLGPEPGMKIPHNNLPGNIHDTLLPPEKTEASLKLMMQFKNKLLDAYQQIMRSNA
ncbi:MAG: flagellar hook-basal body complex protein FliE [Acidobacteria bacterium]|jgi:hypothetical protein|nr:flagellar hook-basal body complex protein FliE [Acidobacteriota bacterium]